MKGTTAWYCNMALINLQNISLSFGGPNLIDDISFQIHENEKIALLGRNGSGKSTLMKIINQEIEPDTGKIIQDDHIKTAILSQDVPEDIQGTVYTVISSGYTPVNDDHHDEQKKHIETERVLSLIEVDANLETSTLSAGMKRRVLLGKALVNDPDLLLLDEPTNHLDLDAIEWLEKFLIRYTKSILFVTHDRMFLQHIASRIIEIDRGTIFDWSCSYKTFLERKEQWLDSEEKQNAEFDKKLAREEEWIRRGIKARRTRNEGRVRALKELRKERAARREVSGSVSMEIQHSDKSGKIVIEAENISFSYNENTIARDFSTTILRGDRVGIIGPNGCGKSTLIKILLSEIEPIEGLIRMGTKLDIAYFDQLRNTLDEEKTVKENVTDGNELIDFNGSKKHVIGYLQDFLFTPDRAAQPVKSLSGGEKNRLLLAKLFTKPANLLILDEPTNDLDIETVELLEELLLDFKGTIILVSHDREFLNNVVTSTLGFMGNGLIQSFAGGYDQYREKTVPDKKPEKEKKQRVKKEKVKTKLSFKEERELESLPLEIEKAESEKERLFALLSDPDIYKDAGEKIAQIKDDLQTCEELLEKLYTRWDELEDLKESFN
jgi:ATP-binding cassette subfamily F protein uup